MRALLLLGMMAGMAWSAASPARLTPEQAKLHLRVVAVFRRAHGEWMAGTRERAIASMQEALALALPLYGRDSLAAYAASDWLSNWEGQQGRWTQAAGHRDKMRLIQSARWGEGHWETVDARWLARTAWLRAGWTKEQNQRWDRAAALAREVVALWKKGQSAKALPLAKEALGLLRDLAGEKHPVVATGYFNLGIQHKALGEYRQALTLYEKALAIHKEAHGERHPLYAEMLNSLARLHSETGNHEAALLLNKRALAIRQEVLGQWHPLCVVSLNNLAIQHYYFGNVRAALRLYRQALGITRETLGEKHPDYAETLNNLAMLLQSMEDHKAALPLHKQALAIRKEALGEKHLSCAQSLRNLAQAHSSLGDHKAALVLSRQALEITRRSLGEKHLDYASSLGSLAGVLRAMEDHEAAVPLVKQMLAIRKEALGETHPDCAQCLHNLAVLLHKLGDHKAALPLFKQAMEITRQAWGEKHPSYASNLHNLASLHEDMGDRKAALPLAEKAVVLTLSHLRADAAAQSDRQQLAISDSLRHRLDLRLSLMDAESYVHALAWKGSVLLRQRQRRLYTAFAADPRTREASEELQATTRLIAALSASDRADGGQLERLTQAQERLQALLSRLSADARAAFEEKPLSPQALAEALPEGAVLVDYLFYSWYGSRANGGKPRWDRHLVAFVTRSGKPTARIDLGPADKIEEAVRRWRSRLVGGESGQPFGAEVKELAWTPLEKHLAGVKAVLLSPDGALASVPFAALPGKTAGTYLLEDVAMAVVPVPRMLPELLKPQDKAKRLGPSLLVVGDVDYDKAGVEVARADRAGDRGAPLGVRREWGRLPATGTEAAEVAKAFTGLFKDGTVTGLSKGKATKAVVCDALNRVRYAHLATHGFFAPEEIKSAQDGPLKQNGLFGREGVTGWHPLLLSGVVVAGANRDPDPGEVDGILTALEVSEMELPRLELAVLSACETGLGKVAGGEGILGMQRAFAIAGTRSVVASLWKVDDAATQRLMGDFYSQAWDPKAAMSRAEALRRAQLAMLFGRTLDGKPRGVGAKPEKLPMGDKGRRTPPHYWAAFVLSGDWR